MKPCPCQPRPGNGYLCDACIHDGPLEGTNLVTCISPHVKDKIQVRPWLMALTPAGEDFPLMRLYYGNSPEPDPVFGKDYTEQCPYFEQDWANDDFAGLDLAREAHKPFDYGLLTKHSSGSRR